MSADMPSVSVSLAVLVVPPPAGPVLVADCPVHPASRTASADAEAMSAGLLGRIGGLLQAGAEVGTRSAGAGGDQEDLSTSACATFYAEDCREPPRSPSRVRMKPASNYQEKTEATSRRTLPHILLPEERGRSVLGGSGTTRGAGGEPPRDDVVHRPRAAADALQQKTGADRTGMAPRLIDGRQSDTT